MDEEFRGGKRGTSKAACGISAGGRRAKQTLVEDRHDDKLRNK